MFSVPVFKRRGSDFSQQESISVALQAPEQPYIYVVIALFSIVPDKDSEKNEPSFYLIK